MGSIGKDRNPQPPVNEKDAEELFFKIDSSGRIRGVKEYAVYEYIKDNYHICIIGGVPFIYEAGVYKKDETGATLKGIITQCLISHKDLITSTRQNRIYNLFMNDPDLQYKMDQMNDFPCHRIFFRNTIYDPIEKKTHAHDPKFRAINQLAIDFPYDDAICGRSISEVKSSNVYRWLEGMFPEADDLEMVLEYLGYCLTTDTRQQKFLIEQGLPGSGKSLLIKLIGDVVGADNISSLPLEKMSHRFASYNLMGKLVNSCGDISTASIEDTTTQKQALGEDYIQAEAKGKDAVSFRPYAKLLFSANGLPTVKNEQSAGFYRRVLIANVQHNVEKMDPMFYEKVIKPDINIFVYMIVKALERMYKKGTIVESRGSKQSVEEMWSNSDPVKSFLNDCTKPDPKGKVERTELYRMFEQYRFSISAEHMSANQFYASLKSKGVKGIKSGGCRYVLGIKPIVSEYQQSIRKVE